MRILSTLSLIIFFGGILFGQPTEEAQMIVGRLRVNLSQDGRLSSDNQAFLEYQLAAGEIGTINKRPLVSMLS